MWNNHSLKSPSCPLILNVKGHNPDLAPESVLARFRPAPSWLASLISSTAKTCTVSHMDKTQIVQIKLGLEIQKHPRVRGSPKASTVISDSEHALNSIGSVPNVEFSRLFLESPLVQSQEQARDTGAHLISFKCKTPPAVDDKIYFACRAEFEYEPLSEFTASDISPFIENFEYLHVPELLLDLLLNSQPICSELAPSEKRLDTFLSNNWFENSGRTAPTMFDLVDAGFYYTGVGDKCRCFWCDAGLQEWAAGAVPWKEHAKASAKCPWVLRCRGRLFVKLVLVSERSLRVAASETLQPKFPISDFPEIPGISIH